MVARGVPQVIVAEAFGLSPSTIRGIVNGIVRPDLAGPLTFSKSRAKKRFVGITLRHDINKWQAVIYFDGKRHRLGTFDDEISAALAYNSAITAHGLRRPLNVIPEIPIPGAIAVAQPYRRYR
jgi:hypothetical protein